MKKIQVHRQFGLVNQTWDLLNFKIFDKSHKTLLDVVGDKIVNT